MKGTPRSFFVRLALRVLGRSGQKEDFYGEEEF
jgi:hypothetical protein